MKCISYFVRTCDMLEQNRHYFSRQHIKISRKQVMHFIQKIWCRVILKNETFFCTGRRGIFTGASGLQIAYVSGREAQQEPAPSHCFTSKDITALAAPLLANSKFGGVDVLLTSQWPRGVWQYGNSPVSAL